MKNKLKKFCLTIASTTMLFNNAMVAYASTDYAKNAGTWLSDQLFWVGLIALMIALAYLLIKRNYPSAVITVLAGGVILYFIKNPEKIGTIGETIANLVFK